MTKNEFIEMLQESLNGEMPSNKIYDNITYYNEYITQSMLDGRTEEDIIDELGEPRLIARTILDAYKISKGPMKGNSFTGEFYQNYDDTQEYVDEDGNSANDHSSQWEEKYYNKKQKSWYNKLVSIIIVLIIIWVIIKVSGFAFNILFTIGIPIILILLFISMITSIFKR